MAHVTIFLGIKLCRYLCTDSHYAVVVNHIDERIDRNLKIGVVEQRVAAYKQNELKPFILFTAKIYAINHPISAPSY